MLRVIEMSINVLNVVNCGFKRGRKMKDEEMAEEWVKQEYPTLQITKVAQRYIKAFLAGLKAGRPQWHDLRKDKKNLPGEDIQREKVYAIFRNNSYYIVDRAAVKNYEDLIAWTELPLFIKRADLSLCVVDTL